MCYITFTAKEEKVIMQYSHFEESEKQGPGIGAIALDARFTPEFITKLGPDDIFVFGSNLAGHHAGGSARIAFNNFGAEWGKGVGLAGNTYAIPTMQGGIETIRPYVDDFIEFARKNPDLTFYVTKIGCGIAGFSVEEIAPLFRDAISLHNIVLPKEFFDTISKSIN